MIIGKEQQQLNNQDVNQSVSGVLSYLYQVSDEARNYHPSSTYAFWVWLSIRSMVASTLVRPGPRADVGNCMGLNDTEDNTHPFTVELDASESGLSLSCSCSRSSTAS